MIKPLHVAPSINSLPFFAKICDNLLHSLNLDPNTIVVKWLEECPSEIWEGIFTWLRDADTKTLLACRETCSDFAYWVDKKTTFWRRMSLLKAVEDNNVDICQRIIEEVEDKNPAGEYGQTPLHEAAKRGHFDIFRLIMENVQDKNPGSFDGGSTCSTPLHWAAQEGHFEICRLIMQNVQDKNPASEICWQTPLHSAAVFGRLKIYRLIMDYVQDKNPANTWGITPLHMAAERGHLEVCRLILKNVQDAYPVNQERVESPLDLARREGHADVCQLFIEHLRLKQK